MERCQATATSGISNRELKQQPPQRLLLHVDDGCAFPYRELKHPPVRRWAQRAAWTAGGLCVAVIAAVSYEYGKESVERLLNAVGET